MSRSTDWVPSLWRETFEELLDDDNELDYGDQWNLNFNYNQTDKVTPEEKRRGWKVYCHSSGFGHFLCTSCSKSWSSARVTLLFRYRLRGEKGSVIMRPFGQACRSCNDKSFNQPGFANEEVENTLLRLFAKIRKNCYGEDDDDHSGNPGNRSDNRKPHEKALCQACSQGICSQTNCPEDDD